MKHEAWSIELKAWRVFLLWLVWDASLLQSHLPALNLVNSPEADYTSKRKAELWELSVLPKNITISLILRLKDDQGSWTITVCHGFPTVMLDATHRSLFFFQLHYLVVINYLSWSSERYFVDIHVLRYCCSCCWTITRNDIHNTRRKASLQNTQDV